MPLRLHYTAKLRRDMVKTSRGCCARSPIRSAPVAQTTIQSPMSARPVQRRACLWYRIFVPTDVPCNESDREHRIPQHAALHTASAAGRPKLVK